jgi:tetratricopeptide (TPR) repeat protein
MSPTLKVAGNSLKRVKTAMEKHGISSQKALAEAVGVSLYKVREFMAGRPIDASSFMQICDRLELDWQKVARLSPNKAEEILGKEKEAEITPAPSPAPAVKRVSIPKLASHLFGSTTEVEEEPIVTPPEPKEEPIVIQPTLTQQPIVTPSASKEEPIVIQSTQAQEPIVTPPEPKEEPIVTQPTQVQEPIVTPSASKEEPIVIQSTPIQQPIVTPSEPKEEPIVIQSTPIQQPIVTPTELKEEPIVIQSTLTQQPIVMQTAEEQETIVNEDELIITEEGNLPVIETVMPHKEESIDWEEMLTAIQTLIDNEQWDEAAQFLQQFNPNQTQYYQRLLELSESLLPAHWRQGGRRISDPVLHGWVLSNAGILAHHLDLLPKALSYLEVALKLTRQYPDRGLEIQCFKGLAALHQSLGNYQAAISYYQQYYDLTELEDLYQEQANILYQLGNIYFALHQYRTAIGYYNQFLNHSCRDQFPIETLKTLRNIGTCYINLKHYESAISHLNKLAELTPDDPSQQAYTAVQIGIAYAGLGLHLTAIEYFEKARTIAAPLDQPSLEMQIVRGLTLSYGALENYTQADRWGREWLSLARMLGNRNEQVRSMYYLRQFSRSAA